MKDINFATLQALKSVKNKPALFSSAWREEGKGSEGRVMSGGRENTATSNYDYQEK